MYSPQAEERQRRDERKRWTRLFFLGNLRQPWVANFIDTGNKTYKDLITSMERELCRGDCYTYGTIRGDRRGIVLRGGRDWKAAESRRRRMGSTRRDREDNSFLHFNLFLLSILYLDPDEKIPKIRNEHFRTTSCELTPSIHGMASCVASTAPTGSARPMGSTWARWDCARARCDFARAHACCRTGCGEQN